MDIQTINIENYNKNYYYLNKIIKIQLLVYLNIINIIPLTLLQFN